MLSHLARTRFAGLRWPQQHWGGRDHRGRLQGEWGRFASPGWALHADRANAGQIPGPPDGHPLFPARVTGRMPARSRAAQPGECRPDPGPPDGRPLFPASSASQPGSAGRECFGGRTRGPRPRRRREISNAATIAGGAVGQRPPGEVFPARVTGRMPARSRAAQPGECRPDPGPGERHGPLERSNRAGLDNNMAAAARHPYGTRVPDPNTAKYN